MSRAASTILRALVAALALLPAGGAAAAERERPFADCPLIPVSLNLVDGGRPSPRHVAYRYENMTNLVVDMHGDLCLFHGDTTPFLFRNCSNVVVRNLTVDFPVPAVTEGVVVTVGPGMVDLAVVAPAGRVVDTYNLRLDKGGVEGLFTVNDQGCRYTPTDARLDNEQGHPVPESGNVYGVMLDKAFLRARNLADGLVRIPALDNAQAIRKGLRVLARYGYERRSATGILFDHCRDVRLENVTVSASHGDGFTFEACHDVKMTRANVARSRRYPGRFATVMDNGVSFFDCSGTIRIEDGLVEGVFRNCVCVQNRALPVKAVVGPAAFLVVATNAATGRDADWACPGDRVRILDAASFAPVAPGEAVVRTVAVAEGGRALRLEFDRAVTNAIAERPAGALLLVNLTRQPEHVVLKGNAFRDAPVTGVTLTGGGNVEITGNSFEFNRSAAVLLRVSADAAEGRRFGVVTNMLVADNTFLECFTSPVAYGGSGVLTISPGVMRPGSGPAYFSNVVVSNNLFSTAAPEATTLWAAGVDGLRAFRNRLTLTPRARRTEYRRPSARVILRGCGKPVLQ